MTGARFAARVDVTSAAGYGGAAVRGGGSLSHAVVFAAGLGGMLAVGILGRGMGRAMGGVHRVDALAVFERAGPPGFRVTPAFVTGLALVAGVSGMCIRAAVVSIVAESGIVGSSSSA